MLRARFGTKSDSRTEIRLEQNTNFEWKRDLYRYTLNENAR